MVQQVGGRAVDYVHIMVHVMVEIYSEQGVNIRGFY